MTIKTPQSAGLKAWPEIQLLIADVRSFSRAFLICQTINGNQSRRV